MGTNRTLRVVGTWVFAFVIVMACATAAFAGDTYWQLLPPATGDWLDLTNWTEGVPTDIDNAWIDNGGTALITVGGATSMNLLVGVFNDGTVLQSGGTNNVGSILVLGLLAGSSGNYELSGTGHLSAGKIDINNGTFNYTGGTMNAGVVVVKGLMTVGQDWNHGGTLEITGGTVNLGAHQLTLDSPSAATSSISGGTLTSSNQYIGYSNTGSMMHTGGTNTVSGDLYLGHDAGSNGTYNLSYGTLSVGTAYVGYSGTGTMTQTGGTISLGGTLYLGYDPGSNGTYNLSYGTLSVGTAYVGHSGTGVITQTSGSNTVSGNLYLGYKAGSSGSYNLLIGNLNVGTDMYVGYNGTGYAVQTGGTNTAKYIFVGRNAGSEGTYDLQAGTVNINNMLFIGNDDATGTFIQSGGQLVSERTSVGSYPGATGTYELSGTGVLKHEGLYIGSSGVGVFRQTGGTHTIYDELEMAYSSYLVGSATYELSDGVLSCAHEKLGNINDSGPGVATFLQSGGTNNAGYIQVSEVSRYEMTGGVLGVSGGGLILGELDLTGSNSTLEQTGGILDLSVGNVINTSGTTYQGSGMSLLILPTGFDPETDFGSFTTTALTHFPGQTLVVPADKGFTGKGTIIGHVHNEGVIESGSSPYRPINIIGGLKVTNDGTVKLSLNGNLVIENQISGQESGHIEVGNLVIAKDGTGFFKQTGGYFRSIYDFIMGENPGSQGTYEYAGGTLVVPSFLTVGQGGTGVFLHSAEQIDYFYNLIIAENEGSDGTYELSGTGELSSRYQNVGLRGTGRFVQTGGTNSCITMTIGRYAGAEGTYELFSGTLNVNEECLGGKRYTSSDPSAGVGRFIQHGGIHEADVYLGGLSGGDGTYELKGGLFSGQMSVGYRHTGLFIQTGGISNVSSFFIGHESGSVGTCIFSGGDINAGYLYVGCYGSGSLEITDAAANITVSTRLSFGGGSEFYAVPGSTIHMTGSEFQNYSTRPYKLTGLGNLTLIFEGGSEDIDPFQVAGLDMGAVMDGYDDNFALGTLQLGGADIGYVQLVDTYDNTPDREGDEALYVYNLILGAGSTLDLNGLNLYYINFTDYGGTVLGGTPTQIPEPATLSLLVIGGLAMLRRRKSPA